jgi:NAD-dependent dihydropyrimidine dehydrogenase PreA subunit
VRNRRPASDTSTTKPIRSVQRYAVPPSDTTGPEGASLRRTTTRVPGRRERQPPAGTCGVANVTSILLPLRETGGDLRVFREILGSRRRARPAVRIMHDPPVRTWKDTLEVTYVIAQPCVDLKDKACIEECPVDCIYEGSRSLYIHPDECVDCGACEPVCPVEAIYYEDDVPDEWKDYYRANVEFFDDLGSPGGAAKMGLIEKDDPMIAALPPQA